jgi:pseudaminic acid cytidylyltransferase
MLPYVSTLFSVNDYCHPMVTSVAVVPARGGSQRIPLKNTKQFFGIPAIVRALRVISASEVFSRVIVSTDDEETASLALAHGAEIPALRPTALADHETTTHPVMLHAIREWVRDSAEIVACVYPVTPFLEAPLLAKAVRIAEETEGYVFPAERSPHPVQRAVVLDVNGRTRSREPQYFFARSQDLEPTYFDVGQFYVARRTVWETVESFHNGGVIIEVETGAMIDVDTPEDWDRAERLYKVRQQLSPTTREDRREGNSSAGWVDNRHR